MPPKCKIFKCIPLFIQKVWQTNTKTLLNTADGFPGTKNLDQYVFKMIIITCLISYKNKQKKLLTES